MHHQKNKCFPFCAYLTPEPDQAPPGSVQHAPGSRDQVVRERLERAELRRDGRTIEGGPLLPTARPVLPVLDPGLRNEVRRVQLAGEHADALQLRREVTTRFD